jgi:hypothetical protein
MILNINQAQTTDSSEPSPLATPTCDMASLPKHPALSRTSTSTFLHRLAALEEGTMPRNTSAFDPKTHLAFEEPSDILTMRDIGFEDVGVSPVAVTSPFQLFSPEAIDIMRSEIVKPEVTSNHQFASNIANAQLRGYARENAPFTYAAWNHPATLAIISKLAGIDLIPWSDYEIAHINLSVKTEEQAKHELKAAHSRKTSVHSDEGIDVSAPEDEKPIVGWHRDAYAFVCVLMLSDCTNMIGGETALRTANGGIIRVRGPTEGCAVILQGRYIEHQALRAVGAKERITAVTSFRPRSPFVKEDTVLRTVRPVSDLEELYSDFAEYRLEIMEQRFRRAREELQASREAGGQFDTLAHKAFLQEAKDFLAHTDRELVPEDKVQAGFVETMDIPDVVVEAPVGGASEVGLSRRRPGY